MRFSNPFIKRDALKYAPNVKCEGITMRIPRLGLIALIFCLVAASSSSKSVFILTFEKPVEDILKVKNSIEHSVKIASSPSGYMEMSVSILEPNRIKISYFQGRPGCSKTPAVDGAVDIIETTKNNLEAEYGPIHIEQHHSANVAP